ncbi:hypothetical protein ACMGDM_02020 [Sphingomonas sp. DT-51]|uniref:hypothetical protein n=1 Tax=Sphingomonas sp. DT-51 TaxID=3396165 RepID=UPI003F1E18ED
MHSNNDGAGRSHAEHSHLAFERVSLTKDNSASLRGTECQIEARGHPREIGTLSVEQLFQRTASMPREDATPEGGDVALRPSPMSDAECNRHHETR